MIFYVICLGAGLVFTVLCAIFGHFFGGHDVDAGGDVGADAGGGHMLSFFSPTVIATFVTAFGATGTILSSVEALKGHHFVIAPLSAISGTVIAYLTWMLFNTAFNKMQGSSESHVSRLVGQEANIITAIPAGGVGEISYVQGGTRYNAPARTEDGAAINTGQLVRIKRIVGSQFYVEPLK